MADPASAASDVSREADVGAAMDRIRLAHQQTDPVETERLLTEATAKMMFALVASEAETLRARQKLACFAREAARVLRLSGPERASECERLLSELARVAPPQKPKVVP